MTKQDVYVESNTAQSLAAQASSRGKTLFSFTNEVLDVALRVLGQGGNEHEIFPAWKTSRVSKDIEGAPFLPGSLIWKMVERLYRSDSEWLLGEWAEAGRRLGERLRILHPTVEDLQSGLSGLQSLIAERKIEVQRKPGGKDRAGIRLGQGRDHRDRRGVPTPTTGRPYRGENGIEDAPASLEPPSSPKPERGPQ